MIQVDHVTMRYPTPRRIRDYCTHPFSSNPYITALNDITLMIDDGDRIAFLGPNGAGKTSLLKLIGGLLLPSKGIVTVNGHDTLRHNNAAKKNVGLVFNEERSFYWRLTGIQNMEFFGTLDNLSGNILKERIDNLLNLVGLEKHACKPVGGYSSGMKQRLAIARGLLSDPAILILDEPTRTLDPVAADTLIELIIDRIHSDLKKTLLIATHSLEKVHTLCSKICIISHGNIISYGDLSVVTGSQTLPAYYRSIVT